MNNLKNKKHKSVKGFTLIELLVVVLIIGILAAIALPQYKKVVLKSRATEALNTLKAITDAQKRYYLVHDVYTKDLNVLDIEINGSFYSFNCSHCSGECCYAMPKKSGGNPWFEQSAKTNTLYCRGTASQCEAFSSDNTMSDYWLIHR